jgi:hypothetical protein
VVFSRQSGKDEMLAQVLAFLLIMFQGRGGEIVVALPSLIPQGQISMRRLVDRLTDARAFIAGGIVQAGEVVSVGRASVRYMSAGPNASARGATASLLLVANESQDIEPDKWDAVFDPMGASTNAPTLFMGTVWTNATLLARAMAAVRKGRLFLVPWEKVAAEVPAYGARVRQRIAELGEEHPFIRTEYRLLPLEGGGMLFPPAVRAQMAGDHARQRTALPGRVYALLLDVAGGAFADDEGTRPAAGDRADSSVLTVVEVERGASGVLPVYRVVERLIFQGVNHERLAVQVADLARRVWRASCVVVDATGIGHGLAGMLVAALGERVVLPFVFSGSSKSKLGYDWLGQIGAGRYREYVPMMQRRIRGFSGGRWRRAPTRCGPALAN